MSFLSVPEIIFTKKVIALQLSTTEEKILIAGARAIQMVPQSGNFGVYNMREHTIRWICPCGLDKDFLYVYEAKGPNWDQSNRIPIPLECLSPNEVDFYFVQVI